MTRHAMRLVTRTFWLLTAALVAWAGLNLPAPSTASAQSRSLSEGPVVRRQLLYRSSRLEVAPGLGMSFGNLYQRQLFVGATATYHLTNSFAAGVNLQVRALNLDTSVASNFQEVAPQDARNVDFSSQLGLVDAHIAYVPFSGKFNMIGNNILHFDFYLTAGAGGALISSDADDLGGFKAGPVFSFGIRTFINDALAINLRVTDYIYQDAPSQRTFPNGTSEETDPRLNNHFIGMASVSIFLPSEVRVSR